MIFMQLRIPQDLDCIRNYINEFGIYVQFKYFLYY